MGKITILSRPQRAEQARASAQRAEKAAARQNAFSARRSTGTIKGQIEKVYAVIQQWLQRKSAYD